MFLKKRKVCLCFWSRVPLYACMEELMIVKLRLMNIMYFNEFIEVGSSC